MQISRVAVLGAGTMGSQIAAHLANASIPCLLLDLPGQASASLDKLKKMDPAPLFDPALLSLIEPLDFESGFPRLRETDWIIEAIVEDLETKKSLLKSILPMRPDAIVTSNTRNSLSAIVKDAGKFSKAVVRYSF
jgi:3-hydroxyacyl-CoA dehydrogenase